MGRFVVCTATHADDFANGKVAWDVLNATGRHKQSSYDELDLSACIHVKPYSLACLAALGLKGKIGGTSPRLVLPSDTKCREYVRRMGLTRLVGTRGQEDDSGEVGPDEPTSTSHVLLQQLLKPDSSFSDSAVALLTDRRQLAASVAAALATHIDELVQNALAHSGSPIGCVVAGQGYTKSVEIAVVDLGDTIPGHLRKNPEYSGLRSDREAISKALEEGVTGTIGLNRLGGTNSGVGLFELCQAAGAARAEMSIISGDQLVTITSNGHIFTEFRGGFAGTLVCVRFLF